MLLFQVCALTVYYAANINHKCSFQGRSSSYSKINVQSK